MIPKKFVKKSPFYGRQSLQGVFSWKCLEGYRDLLPIAEDALPGFRDRIKKSKRGLERMNMKKNKHIGSNFDDFLKEEGILEEIEEVVAKKIFVFQMEKEMKKQGIDKAKLAEGMETSRVSHLQKPNQKFWMRAPRKATCVAFRAKPS